MASSKNFFNGLYEILSETQWTNFVSETSTKKSGALAFGHWTTDTNENVYKIWANNVEYDVVDATAYKALYEHVHNTVDPSINTIETWKEALKLAVADNKISITDIDGEVSIKGSDYVAVSTTGSEIAVSIDEKVHADSADHATKDDKKLATVGYVKDVQDGALKEAKISTAVDAGKATVTLTTKNGKDVETTTAYTVKGDSYITIAEGGNDSSIKVELSVDDSKEKINAATESSTAIATGYAVKEYVADQISALESALELKGSIASNDDAVAKLTTAAASKGDTYVVTDACEYAGEKLENGDLVIVKADSAAGDDSKIIVVERNLDGAVTADAELSVNKVVLGAGTQGVKTSELVLGSDDDTAAAEKTLATEKFVEKLANAAGGKLAGHKSATGVVTVDLTSKEDGTSQGNLGSVVVKGADKGYVSVDFADGEGIKLSTDTKKLADATADADGLATAYDVKTSIQEAIKALDVNDTAVSGQVVVAVSETDGKVSPTRLGVKVNGQLFTTVEEGEGESKVSVLSATIDGADISVGGNSTTYKDKSIAAAIDELSQVVSDGVRGEDALVPSSGTVANDGFVAVSVNASDNTHTTPWINSSILVATAIADSSTVYTNATGLATDAYVKDYVAYELAWEVISDDTNTENA